MLVSWFTHPHNPFTISPEYGDRYGDADIDIRPCPSSPTNSVIVFTADHRDMLGERGMSP